VTVGTTGRLGEWPYSYKTWSGEDGKYEVVNGVQREKWNPYALSIDITEAIKDNYGLYVVDHYESESPISFDNNDTLKLYAKLAAKVKDHDFHLGKAVAEGNHTIKLVRETFKTIVGALVDLKRGDFAYAARRLNVKNVTTRRPNYDLSGRWLELQYGWIPLVHDVFAAMDAFDRLNNRRISHVITAGTFRSQNVLVPPSGSYSWEWSYQTTLKQRIWYDWVVDEDFSAPVSLGLEDPAGIVWEVLPYSFVVDWFLPISAYLDALNTLPRLKGRWMITRVKTVTGKSGVVTPQTWMKFYSGCKSTRKQVTVQRTVGTGFRALDIPLPNLKPLGAALSPLHLTNAAALAHQLFLRNRAASLREERELLAMIKPFYSSAHLTRKGFLGDLGFIRPKR